MRIVFLNPVGFLGGGELSLLDMMASIRRAAPSADLHLVIAGDGPLAMEAAKLGVSVTLVPMPDVLSSFGDSQLRSSSNKRRMFTALRSGFTAGPSIWRYSRAISDIIRKLQPTIIHSNGMKTHLLTRNVQQVGAGVVWHIRDYISPRPLVANIMGFNSKRASIIAISNSIKQDVESVMSAQRVDVIYDSIDTERFYPDPQQTVDLDRLANMPPARRGTIRAGLVATYAKWKGHDVFLKAAAQMIHAFPELPIRFYIVGDPIYQTAGSQWTGEALRDMVDSLGIKPHVGFVPFQKNIASVFRSFDIPVHASTQPEPFGRTIAEAMACGRSMIVSKAGGAAELFVDGEDALGVPPRDPAALAAAMVKLANDADYRHRMGERARVAAKERFALDRIGHEVMQFYDRIIDDLPPRRRAALALNR
jgi:glycosyltransferase involved in cell wall biosynthesis